MKKLLVYAMCFLLAVTSAAQASGLGGLDGLLPGTTQSSGLPDPAGILNEKGTVIQKNYDFSSEYNCTAYTYPMPVSMTYFLRHYGELLDKAGYTLTETVLDHAQAYSIQNGDGKTAYIVPDYQGKMLFLIETGMHFAEKARTNYMEVTYNNQTFELELSFAYTPEQRFPYRSYEMAFRSSYAPFEYLSLFIPKFVAPNQEYFVTKDTSAVKGLKLNMDIDKRLAEDYDGGSYRMDALESKNDYLLVKIDQAEEIDGYFVLSGSWEGAFSNKTMVFTDCTFHASIKE